MTDNDNNTVDAAVIEKVKALSLAIKEPMTTWKSFKVKTIYHVPKVYTQEPMDIYILERHLTYLKCHIKYGDKIYYNQIVKKDSLTASMMAEKKRF